LPIIELEGINKNVKAGDELAVDLRAGEIKNLTTKKTLKFTPLPDFLLEILECGGLEPYADRLIAEGKV
jgi:3-isopropylmalate/(R)-2-methylmalate dehydratase small subunit